MRKKHIKNEAIDQETEKWMDLKMREFRLKMKVLQDCIENSQCEQDAIDYTFLKNKQEIDFKQEMKEHLALHSEL